MHVLDVRGRPSRCRFTRGSKHCRLCRHTHAHAHTHTHAHAHTHARERRGLAPPVRAAGHTRPVSQANAVAPARAGGRDPLASDSGRHVPHAGLVRWTGHGTAGPWRDRAAEGLGWGTRTRLVVRDPPFVGCTHMLTLTGPLSRNLGKCVPPESAHAAGSERPRPVQVLSRGSGGWKPTAQGSASGGDMLPGSWWPSARCVLGGGAGPGNSGVSVTRARIPHRPPRCRHTLFPDPVAWGVRT